MKGGNWRVEWVASTFTLPWNMVYPALLPLMRTPRLPVVDWTDTPADLNGLARFAERRNLVSARVPSHFKRSLTQTHDSWQIQTLVKEVHEEEKSVSSLTDFNLLVKLLSYEGARHRDRLVEHESRNVTQCIIRLPFVIYRERHENWPTACVFWLKWKQSSERNERSAISPLAVFLVGIIALIRMGWPTTAKLSLEL